MCYYVIVKHFILIVFRDKIIQKHTIPTQLTKHIGSFFNWAKPGLLCLFLFFSHNKYSTNLTITDKGVDVVLGTQTGCGRMVGANESTEQQWHPYLLVLPYAKHTKLVRKSLIWVTGTGKHYCCVPLCLIRWTLLKKN